MHIEYLEIVTTDVDGVCATYSRVHGVEFSEPQPGLGNARTAKLTNGGGGMIGIRAPMHETEQPIVRPYLLVNDIESAVQQVIESGGEVAHPPMQIPGHGTFAIYIQGGSHHGLWQV